jgi:hypothetical protein
MPEENTTVGRKGAVSTAVISTSHGNSFHGLSIAKKKKNP